MSGELFGSHRVRKNRSRLVAEETNYKENDTGSNNLSVIQSPTFPLVSLLWSARGSSSQWIVLSLILMAAGLCRCATGFWSYSGFESPPMHGDFEAQRHWMELTINLPMTQWYFHDLEWWGLDYPPLTAYHSWLLGKIGNYIQPNWFELHSSRGLDDPYLKTFMRATVILSEYAVFVPAIVIFGQRLSILHRLGRLEALVALAAILMQPSIILIDHAHFQYNTVMLGLFVASIACVLSNSLGWACAFFVAALSFKQMALYYSPVIFAYLLGTCIRAKRPVLTFLSIASITSISFVLTFAPLVLDTLSNWHHGTPLLVEEQRTRWLEHIGITPFHVLSGPLLQLSQILHRIFPFERGLFEDKVANVWCAIHTFHKLHKYPRQALQTVSLGLTAVAVLPSSFVILINPDRNLLTVATAASAWAFFLFSFQVHEKSVLLPILPMSLLLFDGKGLLPEFRNWIAWANILACWTLYPLLDREQLQIPYFVLVSLWAWLMGVPSAIFGNRNSGDSLHDLLTRVVHGTFYALMVIWHIIEMTVTPPVGKPDLWTVTNVLIGVTGFSLCYAWCLFQLFHPLTKRGWQIKKILQGTDSKPKFH